MAGNTKKQTKNAAAASSYCVTVLSNQTMSRICLVILHPIPFVYLPDDRSRRTLAKIIRVRAAAARVHSLPRIEHRHPLGEAPLIEHVVITQIVEESVDLRALALIEFQTRQHDDHAHRSLLGGGRIGKLAALRCIDQRMRDGIQLRCRPIDLGKLFLG